MFDRLKKFYIKMRGTWRGVSNAALSQRMSNYLKNVQEKGGISF